MIEMQEKHCLGQEHLLDVLSQKITEVQEEMDRLRHVQRELQRLREMGAGLANGERQAEF